MNKPCCCCVCLDEKPLVTLSPCGHELCSSCAQQLEALQNNTGRRCPLCRAVLHSPNVVSPNLDEAALEKRLDVSVSFIQQHSPLMADVLNKMKSEKTVATLELAKQASAIESMYKGQISYSEMRCLAG